MPQLKADRCYRWLTSAIVPLHFIALIAIAGWVATLELGHKNNPVEQCLARLVLAVPAYGHYTGEHGRSHHRRVATPENHAHPLRRCQSLRHFDDLPQLPSGHFCMFLVAWLPPLWFAVMDKRLLALPQIQGDLGRVNVDPRRGDAVLARYGQAPRAGRRPADRHAA